jgi:Acetyltransferase (GNAT) domain
MTSVISGTRTPPVETGTAGSVFRATTPDDAPRLTAFLSHAFSMDLSAPFLDPALMRWKYWEPRADFGDARSYVLERAGRIVGHVALWPAALDTAAGRAAGIQMIDWASDPAAPGAGASLVQRLLRTYDFIYSIGGSEMTRRVLPALGFQQAASVWIAARPLRPFVPRRGESLRWKSIGRMGRNLWWALTPDSASVASSAPSAPIPRTAAFFDYLARCPAAAVRVHNIVERGARQGHLALSTAHGQARVAGVWLDRPSGAGLAAAYTLAQRLARSDRRAPEITAMGSSPASEAAARAAGLRVRARRPVYLAQRKGMTLDRSIEFQIADDDACFRYESPFT